MKKALSAKDRALHIELVRARAAIERQTLRRSIHDLGESLSPGTLARSLLPDFSGGRSTTNWLFRLFKLSRRYPLLISGASTLLSGVGKRHKLVKIGLGLLVSWQLMRAKGQDSSPDHR